MFTGLIEDIGIVKEFKRVGSYHELKILSEKFTGELFLGQSISVSGACLTVTEIQNNLFTVQIMNETIKKTWFAKNLHIGSKINLERALKLSDRLDGHLVLGHVDGTGVLKELHGTETKEAKFFPEDSKLLTGVVPKGSIAIDGVSLTVIDVSAKFFTVGLIPSTLKNCTLGEIREGAVVNLETDILGKYAAKFLMGQKDFYSELNLKELI